MRIALVVPGFSADESDWCTPAVSNLVRELSRVHEIQVYSLRYPRRTGSYRIGAATVHALGGGQVRGLRQVPLFSQLLRKLVREGRGQRPFALIHALFALDTGALAVVAARLLKTPSVVGLMGGELVSLPEIGYGGSLSRGGRLKVRLALRATRLTAGSRDQISLAKRFQEGIEMEYGPLGVDPSFFQPTGTISDRIAGKGSPILLHVGSLVPVKDQGALLKALGLIIEVYPRAHLHMVGEGVLLPVLQQQSLKLGLEGAVTWHGAVAHERLSSYYRAADLCLLSSLHEGQGMVVLEAAACGRTTVGTAVGILPELQPSTRAVPLGEPKALAGAVLQILKTDGLAARLGRECRSLAVKRYTMAATAQRLNAIYEDLVAESLSPKK